MNYRKWLAAISYLTFAVMALVVFGVVAFKFIGVAGAAGVAFVAIAIFINGYIAKVEDNLSGGFNNPGPTNSDKPAKR
jgi:hypothetical protein